jgi:hypothetical protein
MYEKRYLFTDKGKKYKSEKNRRYREKVLLLNYIDEKYKIQMPRYRKKAISAQQPRHKI